MYENSEEFLSEEQEKDLMKRMVETVFNGSVNQREEDVRESVSFGAHLATQYLEAVRRCRTIGGMRAQQRLHAIQTQLIWAVIASMRERFWRLHLHMFCLSELDERERNRILNMFDEETKKELLGNPDKPEPNLTFVVFENHTRIATGVGTNAVYAVVTAAITACVLN